MSYKTMYESMSGNFVTKEFGFKYLVEFFSYLGFSYQFLFFIFALITIFLFFKSYVYFFKGNRLFLSVATLFFIPFFYFLSLNQIRQALAAAIFAFSLRYILNRQGYRYLISILLAFMFHFSALLLLPLYFMTRIKFENSIKVLVTLSFITFVFINPLTLVIDIYESLKLPFYYYFSEVGHGEPVHFFSRIITILTLFIVIFTSKFIDKKDSLENLVLNFMLCFVFIKILALDYQIVDRLGVYFKPLMVVYFVVLLKNLFNRLSTFNIANQRLIKTLCAVGLMFLALLYSSLVVYIRGVEITEYNQYYLNLYLFGDSDGVLEIYDGNK